ncbi:DUF2846 domain-containing protein [Winogradskyella immobilis]|uniref:DUF2846 domain-containing protein n=1 Tax=Winogradskyella immobilis TaxID=2816852 RepID=A0ABS8EJC5_9FLAO|nr:DUF2846 domain-containing protein [Winogradskyella immobilis]MCC1483301.1 hypothetical protein [Winogradskyella immobilis]MCG0015395.1 DUF2846 domain-containing protein [Winogradskyella immobilis]
MKFFTIAFLLLVSLNCTFAQNLEKPSEGKALVYIMRSVDLAGGGLNFRVYDKDIFLGALPSRAYFTYECDPGEHLFWAASENRDFVEATLEANKTYVIDLKAKIGVFIAAVGIEPYSPSNKKHVKRINRVLKKHINAKIAKSSRTEEKKENIEKAMEAYNRIKNNKNSKIKKLTTNMNFENN